MPESIPLAMLRAGLQFAANGRIVSGGSTLTMQLARLMEVGGGRTVTTKTKQMFRALQIERQLSKDQILARYLTLAPYGGNIEGVRAASLAWFGKEPKKLRSRKPRNWSRYRNLPRRVGRTAIRTVPWRRATAY
jgi:penicillin-binding protein 1C